MFELGLRRLQKTPGNPPHTPWLQYWIETSRRSWLRTKSKGQKASFSQVAFFSTLLHRRCPIAKARTVDQKDQLFWNETTTHKRCGATTQDAADSPILTGCGALVFLPKCDAMNSRSDVSEHLVDRQTSFLDETQTLFMNSVHVQGGEEKTRRETMNARTPPDHCQLITLGPPMPCFHRRSFFFFYPSRLGAQICRSGFSCFPCRSVGFLFFPKLSRNSDW